MGYKPATFPPSDSLRDALLDRAAAATWHQRKRKKMMRHIAKKGLDPRVLGFPENYVQPAEMSPSLRQRRPAQWPPARWHSIKQTPHSAEEQNEYLARAFDWKRGKICEVILVLHDQCVPAEQCHHIYGRAGQLLLWEPGWLPVCAEGHLWIHEHPEEARTYGWLATEAQWNDESLVAPPGVSPCLPALPDATVAS